MTPVFEGAAEHFRGLAVEGFRDLEPLYDSYEPHRLQHGAGCHAWPMEPDEVRMIALLGKSVAARKVLELGCGLGYSSLFIARALGPGATVDTVESDLGHSEVARTHLDSSPEGRRVRLHVGDEVRVVASLPGPFDLILHDSGWDRFDELYDELVDRLRPGGLLVLTSIVPTWLADEAEAVASTAAVVQRTMDDPRLFTASFRQWERFLVSVRV